MDDGGQVTRRFALALATLTLTCVAAAPAERTEPDAGFVHPGLLHDREDLARMKRAVANLEEPIFTGFEKLRDHPQSQATYRVQGPFEEIGRNPNVHFREFDQDANAAYQNAIMWAVTGDHAHATKAESILDAWSGTLRHVTGADAVLMAGLGPFKMVNAAEILRYTGAEWPDASARRFEALCREVFYPVIRNFAEYANGNWDTVAIKTMLAIGVFINDRGMFERALRYYVNGAGNGRLTHYIDANGQCQESGRDQQHTQLGLAHLGDASEIAWHQGLDLYGYADNRLLTGFEYTARYLSGEEVPFVPDVDWTGMNRHRVISPRSPFRPVFEQIYAHFAKRMGIPAPFTEMAAAKVRPEGASQGADHPGFGTLLYYRGDRDRPSPPATPPAAAGGLVARPDGRGIHLTWIAVRGAESYVVKRAARSGGPYRLVAGRVDSPQVTDVTVRPGQVYWYAISTRNAAGSGPDSPPLAASCDLPPGWLHADVGNPLAPGSAVYDGETIAVEGGGLSIGEQDQFHFAWKPLIGDGAITARFVPQLASQIANVGLVLRGDSSGTAPEAVLALVPLPSRPGGRGGWHPIMLIRKTKEAAAVAVAAGPALPAPYVTYSRLMEPYWLRLERRGIRVRASTSPDGITWTTLGETEFSAAPRLSAGLAVCSGLGQITTVARFDNVTVTGLR
jgi:hypothetical protein